MPHDTTEIPGGIRYKSTSISYLENKKRLLKRKGRTCGPIYDGLSIAWGPYYYFDCR